MDRRWLIPGLAFTLGLIVLGSWVLLRDGVQNVAPPAVKLVARAEVPTQAAQAPRWAESASDVLPAPPVTPGAGATFRGRVIDALSRAPVTAFEVQLQRFEADRGPRGKPLTRAFRSETGRFAWHDAPVGTWRAAVAARGYQRFEVSELSIVENETTQEIVLPLVRGQTIRGRVFDERSGAGIAAARIFFREAHQDLVSASAFPYTEVRSKQDGAFVLDGVPAGRITLTVNADRYAVRELDVVVEDETPAVEVGLSAGGSISGHLVSADGSAVSGKVSLLHVDRRIGFSRETNAAGEFSFDRLQAGRYRLAGHAGGAATSHEIVLAHDERVDGVLLTLGKGRSVRGRVKGLQPEDFEAVLVTLHHQGKRQNFISRLDERGAYALHGVPPGRAELSARLTSRRHLSRTVEVPENADLTIDLEFARGVRLSGRVTQGGRPMSRTQVWARTLESPDDSLYEAQTSQDGAYEIEDVVEGEHEIQAEEDVARRVRVMGDTVFDIDVPLTQLAGRVLDGRNSLPIVGAGVHVVGAERGAPRIRVYKESDHSGQFGLTGLAPSDILVSVYKPGYEMFRERIAYDSPIADMTIRLRPSRGVEIRLHGADNGAPLRTLFLSETIAGVDGISVWIHLDENGVGSIPAGFAGSSLSFAVSGYAPTVVRQWNAQPLDLQLERR